MFVCYRDPKFQCHLSGEADPHPVCSGSSPSSSDTDRQTPRFGKVLMAFRLGWKNSRSQWRLLQTVSGGVPLFPWRTAGSCLDPEMKAYLEENTEVTSSGSLTPEIQLRLLTPRCKFWWERADLWPYSDPYWAIYWPGGQALSRYVSLNVNLYSC